MSAGCSSQRRSGSSNKENEVPQLCVSPTILCACETQAKKQEYVLVLHVSPLSPLKNTVVTSNFLNAIKFVEESLFRNVCGSNEVTIRCKPILALKHTYQLRSMASTLRMRTWLTWLHLAAHDTWIWSWYVCFIV